MSLSLTLLTALGASVLPLASAGYVTISSRSCAYSGYGVVASFSDCSAAGRALGYGGAVMDYQSVSYDPLGCYYESSTVKFNGAGNTGPCSATDRCICRWPPFSFFGPPSPFFWGRFSRHPLTPPACSGQSVLTKSPPTPSANHTRARLSPLSRRNVHGHVYGGDWRAQVGCHRRIHRGINWSAAGQAREIVPPSYRPRTALVPPSYHPRTTLVPPSFHPRACL